MKKIASFTFCLITFVYVICTLHLHHRFDAFFTYLNQNRKLSKIKDLHLKLIVVAMIICVDPLLNTVETIFINLPKTNYILETI